MKVVALKLRPYPFRVSFESKVRKSRIQNKSGKEELWPLFEFKLWVEGSPEETRWVEYHLHPDRNGVRRTANRGPKEPFSMRIFTHDYWIDARLSDGRRLEGKWLSAILDKNLADVKGALIKCAQQMLGTDYLKSSPTVIRELKGDELDFEQKLEEASRVWRLPKMEDLKS